MKHTFAPEAMGFKPNRSAEQAIEVSVRKINRKGLTFVVDIDVKDLFNEVNYVKLMQQLWTMGNVCDKRGNAPANKARSAKLFTQDYRTKKTD